MTPSVSLYDYQRQMLQRIAEAFEMHRSVMVQMPAGTGKTCLLAGVISEVAASGPVWVLAHRRELVGQIEDTLRQYGLYSMEGSEPGRVRVMSVQWLSCHWNDVGGCPDLIIIDEAHHSLAASYKELWRRYPDVRKLGVTATPCRLRRQSFTGLYGELLQSWSINRFIAEGRLSLYDYMSILPESDDQKIVDSLEKRGADGDFSLREMSAKLDVMPTIGRLFDTVMRYVPGRKGIVYAIDIAHAMHIADYYTANGVDAVAISSKTPAVRRKELTDSFRRREIDVMVNVDLFGEGFDCPDVEFIQLARPTLSLSKYMQQVGRGMRVARGKSHCTILDNVGLYRLFGLPSADRDWQAMFEGRVAGKGRVDGNDGGLFVQAMAVGVQRQETDDERTRMVTLLTHESHEDSIFVDYGYRVVESDGRKGVSCIGGREVLPCVYDSVELCGHGLAFVKASGCGEDSGMWVDLTNGISFARRPEVVRKDFLELCSSDGFRFYPRVMTRMMTVDTYISKTAIDSEWGAGVRFRNLYVQRQNPRKVYLFKEKYHGMSLFEDEHGRLFYKQEENMPLTATTEPQWKMIKLKRDADADAERLRLEKFVCGRNYRVRGVFFGGKDRVGDFHERPDICVTCSEKTGLYGLCRTVCGKGRSRMVMLLDERWMYISPPAFGIRICRRNDGKYVVKDDGYYADDNVIDREFIFAEFIDGGFLHLVEGEREGEEYWVDLKTQFRHDSMPVVEKVGFLELVNEGDMCFVRNHKPLRGHPFSRKDIKMGVGVCFIGRRIVFPKEKLSVFRIVNRCADNRHFVITEGEGVTSRLYDMYYDGEHTPRIVVR